MSVRAGAAITDDREACLETRAELAGGVAMQVVQELVDDWFTAKAWRTRPDRVQVCVAVVRARCTEAHRARSSRGGACWSLPCGCCVAGIRAVGCDAAELGVGAHSWVRGVY